MHLSDAGRAQAARLAAYVEGWPLSRILCSPLDRCRETASPVAERFGLTVEDAEALNEIDCGNWTGMTFDALSEDPHWRVWNAERGRSRIPGGESALDVQFRAMTLIERLAAQDRGPSLLVTHSDVIKTIVLSILGTALDHHDRIVVDPASISTLDLWPGGGRVVRLNEEAGA